MGLFVARITDPLQPLAGTTPKRIPADVFVKSGTISTTIAGGYGVASLDIEPDQRDLLPFNGHFEIFGPGGFKVHDGRAQQGELGGEDDVSLTSNGYGICAVADQEIESSDTSVLNSDAIIARAIGQVAPLIRIASGTLWQSCPLQYPYNHFSGSTLFEAINEISQASLYDFMVWEHRIATFQQRIEPTTPDYLVAAKDCTKWGWDTEKQWTRVTVTYTPTDGTTSPAGPFPNVSGQTAQEIRYGISRRTTVNAGTTTYAGAAGFGENYLAQFSDPVITASIGPIQEIATPLGAMMPAYTVRPGQWVEVQRRGMAIVVSTSIDWETGATTIQLGNPEPDDIGFQAKVTQAIIALRRGRNANSGAPAG